MNRINKICLNCIKQFTIPRCRDWREHCCSSVCKKEYREKIVEEAKKSRKSFCKLCDKEFYPRKWQLDTGQGIYCSSACQFKETIKIAHLPEANKKRGIAIRELAKRGILRHKKGAANPRWLGGRIASRRRRTANGKASEVLRAYRKANPHKTREWQQNRRQRKNGRLPNGTILELFELQRGLCAFCHIKLNDNYHVDHIQPLSRGGIHERENIQLLCPTCNVRKSAKDPIKFAQENGRLL